MTMSPMESVDLTRRFSTVRFDDVRVPATAVIGEIGAADQQVERQLQRALAIGNAESVGAMQTAFDMTVEWAFDRYSFGRPLASYQELKHRFADMKTWLEAGHAVSDAATGAVATGSPDADELLSAAASFIGDYGSELVQDCVQIHGGIGLTFDHDIHLYLRRHTLGRALYGTPADHRQRLAAIAEAKAAWRERRQDARRTMEDIGTFRARARAFVRDNLRPVEANESIGPLRNERTDDEELAAVAREREVQRMLFDAGLAGICVPAEYGGQGLTPAHQRALNEELVGHEYPARIQAPTLSPCAAVLLDFGTEEQKLRHIPAILKGEEIWMQFLSEPSGGSDVAAALTSAVRDGEEWVLNGSKIWTTGAWWSDWGLCLARTNWDVPKHRGLTVFILPIRQAGLDVHRIEMLNGSKEFCQEFLTDVRVPDSDRLGDVDDGWTVGTRWMFHERMLTNSPLVTVPAGKTHGGSGVQMDELAREAGRLSDPSVRDLVGEARMLEIVDRELRRRIGEGIATGAMADQSAAIGRLFSGVTTGRMRTIAFEIAGATAAAWTRGRRGAGLQRDGLPDAAGVEHRRRHHGDGPKRHQRAGARDATGAVDGPGRAVPRRPAERFVPAMSRRSRADRFTAHTVLPDVDHGDQRRVVGPLTPSGARLRRPGPDPHPPRVQVPAGAASAPRSAGRPGQRLRLEVLVEPGRPVLPADAAVLVAAEGQVGPVDHPAVDTEHAGADPAGHRQRPVQRCRDHRPAQAVVAVVGDPHGVIVVVEGDHHQDGPEDLLPGDGHGVVDAR